MPAERVSMRRVREMLRYRAEQGLGYKAISLRVGAVPSTVRETLKRAAAAGLAWPLADDVSDAALEVALYREAGNKTGHRRCAEPDWPRLHREMQRKHVTLQILWDEYIAAHPDGYRYSRFCDLYRAWSMKLPVTMRQNHAPGDKLFVDYAGDKLPILDRLTGEVRATHIFVGVLGASSLSYAEATWTETLPDWIGANVRAVEAFGGAPALFVPDNAKVAVIKACLYDPQVNRSYAEMAVHYGSAVLPTRPRRPRDKAKVEAAVLIVERWLFGRLRHRIFHSLAELNAAIAELIANLNDRRVLRRVGVTRRQLFEELDRPALKPLPAEPYVYAEWRRRRAGLDYHVEIERHYYSVPYRFAREPIEARITARTIELFHQGERVFANALPQIVWQPSDSDEGARASIEAWRTGALPNLRPPLALDAIATEWPIDRADAIFCANMVHISPWAATLGLLRGACRPLPSGGPLILYGPFRRRDVQTAPSNEAFDLTLHSQDPQWGLRSLELVVEQADREGLVLDRTVGLPANNLIVIMRKR